MADRVSPLFDWRSAIGSAHGPTDRTLTVAKKDGRAETFTVKGATMRHVGLTLSLHMSQRGGSCWPGIPRLATETGLNDRTVQRALRGLLEGGWLGVERQAGGRGKTNLYVALIPEGFVWDEAPVKGGVESPFYSLKGGVESVKGGVAPPKDVREDVSTKEQVLNPPPRNHVWDALVSLFGEPTSRNRSARGRIVADLRELGTHDGLEGEKLGTEIRQRHEALAAEWGSRATARALVENWAVAGRLAGRRPGGADDPYAGIDDVV